jgi:hypothetical protein
MKTLSITNVRTIFSIAKPIVVFDVAEGESIVRNPKQALIDLQNSGRALKLRPNALANGIESLNAVDRETFIESLMDCVGATLTGDITPVRKGDTYVANEYSSCIADKNHKLYGKVKLGEVVTVEEDSSPRVEGFLSIPLTQAEKLNRGISREVAGLMSAMFGFSAPVAQTQVVASTPFELPAETPANAFEEGVGTATTKK